MAAPDPVVRWSYQGKTNLAFGTGATAAEQLVGWAAGLIGLGLFGVFFATQRYPWAIWQHAVGALIAADVAGGVVANSLNSCKRFYLSPPQASDSHVGRLMKNHFLFTAMHIHTLAVGLLFRPVNLAYALAWYPALLLSALAVLAMPLYLRRPLAMLAVLVALLANFYLIPAVPGFEWLAPALFLKIVYGHLVREEPYRPDHES